MRNKKVMSNDAVCQYVIDGVLYRSQVGTTSQCLDYAAMMRKLGINYTALIITLADEEDQFPELIYKQEAS